MKITFKDLEDSNCHSVTDYCRLLVSENKEDLDQTIEVYRGEMLCLIVTDIREAAKIMPTGDGWTNVKKDRVLRGTKVPYRGLNEK